ncbi:hypothetical protein DV735_g3346, partial [Chaetothyriales sp. CBS 134920]
MTVTNQEWNEEERLIITKPFAEKAPKALSSPVPACTEESCIEFAKETLETEDTVSIYGHLVPEVSFHGGFPLPVYSSKSTTGRVHVLQAFPENCFPLAREKLTLAELGAFVAKAAFFPQLRPFPDASWTKSAPDILRRLSANSSFKKLAPDLFRLITDTLQPRVHLLDSLPAVLTHHDFSQVSILVDDSEHLTGVIDFDEAQVEAFWMCISGLDECFFGSMEDVTWYFYDIPADYASHGQQTEASLSIGIIQRYFIQGMVDEIDLSKKVHRSSLEYAKGILPEFWY